MGQPAPISRRSFLAGGAAAGIGLSLGPRAVERAMAAGRRPGGHPGAGRHPVVRAEPPAPPPVVRYVSRPDLTPVGVSIRSTPEIEALGNRAGYLFCAPKPPAKASPGRVPVEGPFPAGASPGLMILDTSGELVWFKPLPGVHEVPFNFRVQTYRGRPTLTWFQGTVRFAHGMGHYVLADSTYGEIAQVVSTGYPCDLHEFIVTPEDTALHTAYDDTSLRVRGLPTFIGHAQEVDVATNELVFDWASYPEVGLHLSEVRPGGGFFDYFHINSIDLWPGTARDLLVSSRNTSAVYLVDRQTKRVRWRVGGKRSDFAMGRGSDFYFQHDARSLADGSGISLFDDASPPCPERYASGKVLRLDQAGRTATLVHRYRHTDGEMSTPSQGNCQLLANGGHMVGWGFQPYFSIYAPSPDGVLGAPLVLDGRFAEGAASYRSFLFDWVGNPPQDELALVVRRTGPPGQLTGWASWNGATEVAAWRVSGGPLPATLRPLVTTAKLGFETAIPFAGDGATTFELEALDVNGQVLGRSLPVPLD
ncbi:MAG: aryl-sulfate sulfotransferase [Actinomycetota bacterium]|nr:aryl-sulfate sulfotransferase [Actinomycetota bacterium]